MRLKRIIGFSILTLVLTVACVAAVVEPVSAQSATTTISKGLDATVTSTGAYSKELTLTVFIGNLIKALLGATGIAFLVLTIWGGINYMTAAGDDTKIKTAKARIVSALIGLIIIVGAYALTSYVVDALTVTATQKETENTVY